MFKVRSVYFIILISVICTVSCQEKNDKNVADREYLVLDAETIDSFLVNTIPERLTRKEEVNGDISYSKIATTEFINVRVFKTIKENSVAYLSDSALSVLISNCKIKVDTSEVSIDLNKQFGQFSTNQLLYGKIGLRRIHYGIRVVDGQCLEISTDALSTNRSFEKEVNRLFTQFANL